MTTDRSETISITNYTMKVKFLQTFSGARLPEKATSGSAAYDLYVPQDAYIEPGRHIIPLGFAMEMDEGYEALIDPRSGFSAKGMEGYQAFTKALQGETIGVVATAPTRFDCDVIEGKIDADYRGVVGVIVHNRTSEVFMVKAGTRIAQMTFHKVETVEWEEVKELSQSNRKGGFGSTGEK